MWYVFIFWVLCGVSSWYNFLAKDWRRLLLYHCFITFFGKTKMVKNINAKEAAKNNQKSN